jgi:hypothetical protein
MAGLRDLMKEYERSRFPADRRLDLQGEAPRQARERALRWIQSRAHEAPGEELLLILERGLRPGQPNGAATRAVEGLLREVEGKLIDWWQPFAPGSLALRVALQANVLPGVEGWSPPADDGRTAETAGAALPPARADIPVELLGVAERAAELRREREGLSVRLLDVVLREVWNEAQALAMSERLSFGSALDRVLGTEARRAGVRA